MYNAIKRLYPQAVDSDFILQDDGDGAYISYWDTGKLGAPPSPASLTNDTPRVTSVTMRQARCALILAGLMPAASAALAAIPGVQGELARAEWEYSQEVQRDRGLVASLGTSLGMTPNQLDALFTTASQLP